MTDTLRLKDCILCDYLYNVADAKRISDEYMTDTFTQMMCGRSNHLKLMFRQSMAAARPVENPNGLFDAASDVVRKQLGFEVDRDAINRGFAIEVVRRILSLMFPTIALSHDIDTLNKNSCYFGYVAVLNSLIPELLDSDCRVGFVLSNDTRDSFDSMGYECNKFTDIAGVSVFVVLKSHKCVLDCSITLGNHVIMSHEVDAMVIDCGEIVEVPAVEVEFIAPKLAGDDVITMGSNCVAARHDDPLTVGESQGVVIDSGNVRVLKHLMDIEQNLSSLPLGRLATISRLVIEYVINVGASMDYEFDRDILDGIFSVSRLIHYAKTTAAKFTVERRNGWLAVLFLLFNRVEDVFVPENVDDEDSWFLLLFDRLSVLIRRHEHCYGGESKMSPVYEVILKQWLCLMIALRRSSERNLIVDTELKTVIYKAFVEYDILCYDLDHSLIINGQDRKSVV